jgi:hypothetical protein
MTTPNAAAGSAPEGDSPAERVLQVKEIAERLMVALAGAGDATDLGRAACVCTALRDASAVEAAWEIVCTARLPTSVAARASLQGAAAAAFSWRGHFIERVTQPWSGADSLAVDASLKDMALLLVDVWHRGALVFSATLSPAADEMLEEETYSDSDDLEFDEEWKAEFAIKNEQPGERVWRAPVFVGARALRASAWLLRRDGRLVRVMRRAAAHLDTVTDGSVAWAGTRNFRFSDGPSAATSGRHVQLNLAGWLVEEKTGYRWWPDRGPQPPQQDARRLTRLRVRWGAPS